jgi:hypothetical protein
MSNMKSRGVPCFAKEDLTTDHAFVNITFGVEVFRIKSLLIKIRGMLSNVEIRVFCLLISYPRP